MSRILAHTVRRYSETKRCCGWRTLCAATVKRNTAAGGAHCAPLRRLLQGIANDRTRNYTV